VSYHLRLYPDKNARARAQRKRAMQRDPERQKHKEWLWQLKSLYGLSGDQYNALYNAQGGCCAICGRTDKRLAVDHDHSTGYVRGLLCGRCNPALGAFRDSVSLLQDAIDYLKWSRGEEDDDG
jgi:Recombination endonuclease VII